MNDKKGTNSRRWGQEEFVPNRQEVVEHDGETRSGSKSTGVCQSRHGCVSVDIQTKVQEGKQRVFILKGKPWKHKRNKISGQCSGATRVPSGRNTALEEPKIRRSERG